MPELPKYDANEEMPKQKSRRYIYVNNILRVGRESHAAHPLGVALVCDRELAVAEGVPELDGAVA